MVLSCFILQDSLGVICIEMLRPEIRIALLMIVDVYPCTDVAKLMHKIDVCIYLYVYTYIYKLL